MRSWVSYLKWFGIILVVSLFVLSWGAVEADLGELLSANSRRYMGEYVLRLWPPNFEVFPMVLRETLVTIELAFVSTVIAAILSLPFGFLAANNIMTGKFGRVIAKGTRFVLNANRAIDALIVALFFVSALGPGPFAGTLALAIHSVGMLGKLYFESIEGVDRGPIEALESSGASRLQVIRWAVVPQVLPYFMSHALFRFELNIRGAVVLGLVGAGGIGFLLNEYMRLFQQKNLAVVLLTILALVMTIDAVSGWARRKLL